MFETPGCILHRHHISRDNGFLPEHPPLQRLHHSYYAPWERIAANLPDLISKGQLRATVDSLPVLETTELTQLAELRRAYVLLAFLTHAYIWAGDVPSNRLPPSISIPFSDVAQRLGLPPTATYAATNLWNWKAKTPESDLTNPDNLRMVQTFTGTLDEEWFYQISVSIEQAGAPIIPIMLDCFTAVRTGNISCVVKCLQELTTCIHKLGRILERMYEKCQPQVFYHQIRPFLAGSKGMQMAGLPDGVFYDEGNGFGQWRQHSGGSNAQSSLIQLLDIVLGIEHYSTGTSTNKSSAPAVKSKQGYILEMRNYMPREHRDFLQYMVDVANVRDFVMNEECDTDVVDAYNLAVESLAGFRDKHIQIVSRYIIAPSRATNNDNVKKGMNLAKASMRDGTKDPSAQAKLSGTGGTTLIPFLKQTRDETKEAARESH